jgi:hypothetical protein
LNRKHRNRGHERDCALGPRDAVCVLAIHHFVPTMRSIRLRLGS